MYLMPLTTRELVAASLKKITQQRFRCNRFAFAFMDPRVQQMAFPLGEPNRDFVTVETAAAGFVEAVLSCEYALRTAVMKRIRSCRPQGLILFTEECWPSFRAVGRFLPDSIARQRNEVTLFVPHVPNLY
jgi:hypothetical protein